MTTTSLVTVEVVNDSIDGEQDFDYQLIADPCDREWAESAAGFITFGLGQAVVKVLEAGNLLAEAKRRLPHGEYLPWVEQACQLKPSYAAKLIKAAERVNVEHVPHLSDCTDVTTLFLLSADTTTEEVREWFMEQCKAGKVPSRKEVQERKRQAEGRPDKTIIQETLAVLKLRDEARQLAEKAVHISTRQLMDELGVEEPPKGKQHQTTDATYCKNGTGWWKLPIVLESCQSEVEPTSIDLTVGLMTTDRAAQILGVKLQALRTRMTPGMCAKHGAYKCNGYSVTREGRGMVRLIPN